MGIIRDISTPKMGLRKGRSLVFKAAMPRMRMALLGLGLGLAICACASAEQGAGHIGEPGRDLGPDLASSNASSTQKAEAEAEASSSAAPQTALDKNCKPTYPQIYQPPLKLGGSGRILNIKTGVSCE